VQYCVQQLYTVNCTHIWTDLTVLWIGFCLTGAISLCIDLFLCMYYFVSDCILHACVLCSIVTWWGGPGGIEAWSLGLLVQCFDTVGWVIWPVKPVPDMTYNVFSGTLNPAQSFNLKKRPTLGLISCYNSDTHERILIIFGRGVTNTLK